MGQGVQVSHVAYILRWSTCVCGSALTRVLLVVLQDREMDVRRGLLKIVVHVLQHHGEELSRGWVPLLR